MLLFVYWRIVKNQDCRKNDRFSGTCEIFLIQKRSTFFLSQDGTKLEGYISVQSLQFVYTLKRKQGLLFWRYVWNSRISINSVFKLCRFSLLFQMIGQIILNNEQIECEWSKEFISNLMVEESQSAQFLQLQGGNFRLNSNISKFALLQWILSVTVWRKTDKNSGFCRYSRPEAGITRFLFDNNNGMYWKKLK